MDSSHRDNRRRLAALLPAGSLAVIATGRWPLACGADSAAPWPDFFHLTGQREPHSALLIEGGGAGRTILLLPPRDARSDLWDGPAELNDGITDVRPVTEFENVLRALAHQAGTVFVHAPENPFAPQDDRALADLVRRVLPLHPRDRLAPLLGRLRADKQPAEIAHLRAANELAARAFRRALGFVRPGVRGFEVKAEFLHEIMRQGSAGFACPSITAAGAETLTLHWRGDRRPWAAGETALLDFTVEWNGCCADVARCIPVGGKFPLRHRAVYDAVARVLQQSLAFLRPGRLLADCQRDIELAIQHELLRLGLLTAAEVKDPAAPAPALRRFFMHQACHHIGLEVHDPVPADVPLAPGQVLAVEPAIYVRDEGFAIRLENNVLITANGAENLTAGLPVDAAEIESLLQI
jgi:Xaa-Pro aminopeptidase